MSSSNSLTPKTHLGIKQRVASCYTTEVISYRNPKSGCHGNLLSCRLSTISVFCRLITQTPSVSNRSRYLSHKPSYSNLVPKLVANATSLRPWISAMSSSDRLTPKTRQ